MEPFYPSLNQYLIVLAKRATGLLFPLLICLYSNAQTTNIDSIVNSYHRVIEIITSRACVRVSSTVGLSENNKVLLVQMKGATINTTNTASFGDVGALNDAGNYETGTICRINGDSVFLFFNLLRTYDVSAKVQLVRFAEYYSANVVDTLKAARWDSTAGTGGVIAIFATQDITLNAPIYADSSGYAGGAFFNHSGTCNFLNPVGTGYVYDATTASAQNGAYKGEGVAILSGTQDGAKGAPANGGGGGNNHNNSGGGGANLTAGGNGGGNSSSGPSGCNTANNWGRGGKALSSSSGQKIYLGGGGGAGHSNNGSAVYNHGGAGGGIVFIWASNLNGNNGLISASGGAGGPSESDGAGGGGAGGTIIMNVTTYTGNVTLRARGGVGGESQNNTVPGRCFGGGGGGAGGQIYFTGSTPAVTIELDGGLHGDELNRDAGCNAAVPGTDGTNGSFSSDYTVSTSTNPSGSCSLVLPSQLLYFRAKYESKKVGLNWRVLNPETINTFIIEKRNENNQWVVIHSQPAYDSVSSYSSVDNDPLPGYNYYRLKITERSGLIRYSAIQRVFADNIAGGFMIFPNPAKDKITIRISLGATSMLRMTDVSGKLVLQKQLTGIVTELPLPALPPGVYMIEVNGNTKKLIIR